MIEQTKITNTAKLEDILFDRVPKPLKFENELWEAADNLRASARLKSSEYPRRFWDCFFCVMRRGCLAIPEVKLAFAQQPVMIGY